MAATSEDKPKTRKVVAYVGTSTERDIDKKSFESVGVQDQEKVTWTLQTGHEVPIEKLNADAVRFLTERTNGEFVVREVPAD